MSDPSSPETGPTPPAAEQHVLRVFAERIGKVDVPTTEWNAEAQYKALAGRLAAFPREERASQHRTGGRAGQGGGPVHTGLFSGQSLRSVMWSPLWRALTLGGMAMVGIASAFLVVSDRTASRALVMQSYTTGVGQCKVLALEGARIILAPQSAMIVKPGNEHTITLLGEAYFTVTPAIRHMPFVVRTGAVTIRVLGTAFDVRHYPSDVDIRVAVTQGRVMVKGHRRTVTLVAGKVGHVTDSTAVSMTPHDVGSVVAWTTGRLVFHDTPVPEMLASISRWYGYDFQLTDSMLTSRYVTVTFDIGDTTGAMTTLHHLLGVTIRVEGNRVVLTPQHVLARDTTVPRYLGPTPLPNPTHAGR